MASTRLAEAVGYPGSSVAFAQLLSGMERDGLISREVRGKRTYRITLSAPPAVRIGPSSGADNGAMPAEFGGAPDYDELADRVLIRLLRRLTELRPAELAALERLLVPGHPAAEEVTVLRAADAADSVDAAQAADVADDEVADDADIADDADVDVVGAAQLLGRAQADELSDEMPDELKVR